MFAGSLSFCFFLCNGQECAICVPGVISVITHNAFRALGDTQALERAVHKPLAKTNELEDGTK